MQALEVEAGLLSQYESESYNSQLSQMLAEEERMKKEMEEAEEGMAQLQISTQGLG